jgi:hypothetical protein
MACGYHSFRPVSKASRAALVGAVPEKAFENVLQEELRGLRFSRHAQERLIRVKSG